MAAVARAYDTLMRRLGYESYGTHGSDGGAMVSRELAVLDPPGFLAHVLQLFSFPSGRLARWMFGPKEYAALEFLGWFQSVGGYNGMNGTRPQTIAAALSDSPVGQLAYNELFENFGNGTSLVSPEQVLTQVTLYWLTNTSANSVRYHYAEGHSGAEPQVSHGRTGVAVFKDDFQTIRPLAERDNANIVHWSEFERGGHYAALEVPELVVGDLRTSSAEPSTSGASGSPDAPLCRVGSGRRTRVSASASRSTFTERAVADLAGQQGLGQPVADLLLYQPS